MKAAHAMGLRIGDIEDIVGIERNGRRPREIDFESRTIAIKTVLSCAHHRRDNAGFSVHPTNAVAA